MKTFHWVVAATISTATVIDSTPAAGEEAGCARVTRANLVSCALAASLAAEVERHGVDAARGREEAARPLLPSNPVLSGWVARRSASGFESDTNWSLNLSQEIEISGERAARLRSAAFGRSAQEQVLVATKRQAAAEAWRAYFDALANDEALRLVRRLSETAQRVAVSSKAASDRGLVSGVDADVADASFVRIENQRIAAEGRASRAKAVLASAMGLGQGRSFEVTGALEPLALPGGPDTATPAISDDRPELRALEAEARSERERASMFRRSRVPSPKVSVFVERDGFAERVLGAGLALPIPLPHPLGRTASGEIAEAESLEQMATSRARRVRRDLERDLAGARAAYEASRADVALYTPERKARAEQGLASMAAQIESGRLGIRDAIVAQEALVGLLIAELDARRRLCLSSVDLAYARGVALERGAR
jgi:cobalt-zinc-cadmium efflux system outer membrane protein